MYMYKFPEAKDIKLQEAHKATTSRIKPDDTILFVCLVVFSFFFSFFSFSKVHNI